MYRNIVNKSVLLRPLTAVILLVVVMSELLAVVTTTDQVSLTPCMSIMLSSVTRSITVSLSLLTRVLWSTTSPSLEVTSTASLTISRLKGNVGVQFCGCRCCICDDLLWSLIPQSPPLPSWVDGPGLPGSPLKYGIYSRFGWVRLHAAVIFLVEICGELLAVVISTNQVILTVAIVFTITLSQGTRCIRGATNAFIYVTSSTPFINWSEKRWVNIAFERIERSFNTWSSRWIIWLLTAISLGW